jgi:hypothetical protein
MISDGKAGDAIPAVRATALLRCGEERWRGQVAERMRWSLVGGTLDHRAGRGNLPRTTGRTVVRVRTSEKRRQRLQRATT